MKTIDFANIDLFKVKEALNLIIKSIFEGFKDLPNHHRKAISNVAKSGWYISYNTNVNFVYEISEHYEKNHFRKIDNLMSIQIESNIEKIRKLIIKVFPKRKKVLNSAFNAHNSNDYYLSIPVFLTQIDGICIDITNRKFFSRRKGMPLTKEIVGDFDSKNPGSHLLEPLRIQTPISASKNEFNDYSSNLNRHEILHGIDLKYGNRINSLKSISLLYYLSDIVFRELKNNN